MNKERILEVIVKRSAVADYSTYTKALAEVEEALDVAADANKLIRESRANALNEAWNAAIWWLLNHCRPSAAEALESQNCFNVISDYLVAKERRNNMVEANVKRLVEMYGRESVFKAIDKMREEKNP